MTTPEQQLWPLFVTAARGLEPQLADELTALGADAVKPGRGGVHCVAELEALYTICMCARLASRVLLPLGHCAAETDTALYDGCRAIDWAAHLAPGGTLAVDFSSSRSNLKHTRFGAQRVKDAIVDTLREQRGERPDVDREQPDCRINAYVLDNRAQLALDLGGGALHRRPWLAEGARPPVPANLAAALLQKSGWPDARYRRLVSLWAQDGTLAIEAHEIAHGLAANRHRTHWGFVGWAQHDAALWSTVHTAAKTAALQTSITITAVEPDRRQSAVLRSACRATGVDVTQHTEDPATWLTNASLDSDSLIVATPLADAARTDALWRALGEGLKAATHTDEDAHSHAAALVPALAYGKQLGLRASKRNQYWIGTDDHTLLQLPLDAEHKVDRAAAEQRRHAKAVDTAQSRGADGLVNRIKKNQRTLGKWAKREGISCFRLYDADLPEYAFAIDLYGDHAHIQEYAAPASIDPARAAQRLDDAMAVLPGALGVRADQCVLKRRQRQRGAAQYRKHGDSESFIRVSEGPALFAVNLRDYLDTGLFLDHRLTRALVAELSRGKRLLNLFGYTGSVTVQAALAGATTSLTVDMSQTYLDWAGRNFSLNKLDGRAHRLQRADVLSWLDTHDDRYDVIFLDPPTFSNSKNMATAFDVQRDHVALIRAALARLSPGGKLVFSNNYRRFR
ncbi:MAG: bifunctional 23S rRNA (guanine(2069)-N(7))-methyltransferase RlmK/23S rRNA (guanine(2445)-N(2))-methyltransferase RlmL, partial [Pseudomonadota bacterium]